VGERGFTVQRLLNIRDGYDAKTDVLPKKMLRAASKGMRAGQVPPVAELLQDYYQLRGWDRNGEPTAGTLARLDLAE
jgi:aldehyde:ferredoxin oxidoreductase